MLLFAAAVLTQAPLAVGLLGFFLLLTLLLVLEVRYLRGKVEAELKSCPTSLPCRAGPLC